MRYRLEKKEEEILGEVLQALQNEKDKCKSLATQVWDTTFYLNIYARKADIWVLMSAFFFLSVNYYEDGALFNSLLYCV